jgi:GTPase
VSTGERRHESDGTTGSARLGRAELRRQRRDVIEEGRPQEGVDVFRPVERAVLVGVQLPDRTDEQLEASLDELEALVDTAGAEVADRVVQRRGAPDPATYIGKGKVDELRGILEEVGADAVVFDDELTPAQQRTLEERVGQKVLDRTIVILDIFAQHATSREGKTQVELAQLDYLLPRLRGWGEALSRQAGGRAAGGAGIGGRGPGETQLEVDRRRIHRRIRKLKEDLETFDQIRQTKAKERESSRVPVVALVGYTNAGKSSLLNRLTGSGALVQDRLFATLDTTVRGLALDDGRDVVVTDTVGFVRKLPHGLVEAFKSTLEESTRADLLLHVVDTSHADVEQQIEAVRDVLTEIGAGQVPEQVVLNKIDLAVPADVAALGRRLSRGSAADPVEVSAATGEGIDQLLERIARRLPDDRVRVHVTVPFDRTDLVDLAHRDGEVHEPGYSEHGTELVATVTRAAAREMREVLDPTLFMDDDRPRASGDGQVGPAQ